MLLEKKRKGFRRERERETKKKNTNNTKALEKKYYTQRDYKRRCSPQEKKSPLVIFKNVYYGTSNELYFTKNQQIRSLLTLSS